MVQALVGREMEDATTTCGYCETRVYDPRFYPVRAWGVSGGWCACCFRREALPGDRFLVRDYEWADDEHSRRCDEFDARHRKV